QEQMHSAYRGWSPTRRMQHALKLVLEGTLNQSEAARKLGISRPRLNNHVQAHKLEQKQREERSGLAAQERRQHRQVDPAAPEVQAEAEAAISEEIPDFPDSFPAEITQRDRQPDNGGFIPSSPLGIRETRRIPPIGEFVRRYFDGFKCFDCGVHHPVPKFHDEMMEFAQDPTTKRGIILVPPGHSKSTCVTVWGTVHDLYRDPNMMISIISAGTDLAQAFVYQIANLLTNTDLYEDCTANLIDELGSLREPGSGWSAKGFYVGRVSPEKDPSLRAYGWGSDIYGRRQHKIIVDDIAGVDNQNNPDQVEKMRRKIVREYDTRVGDNGKLIILGTRIHPDDVYSHLLKLPDYQVYKRACVIDEAGGETLWPEHFPIEAAKRARGRMTPSEFELVYQNADIPTTESIFTEEQLQRCRDNDRILGEVPAGCAIFIGIDPAGAGEQAGFTAMVCYAIHLTTGQRYVIDISNVKQMRAYQLKDQIFEWVDMYRPRELIVEANGLQSQLVQYNQELLIPLAEKGVRVSGHITHAGRGKGGKTDHQFGIQAMAPLFHNGVVRLPWGDINTRRKVGELEHQLLRFPHGLVTDLVMALWIAETGVKSFWATNQIESFDPRTTAQWPSRITNKRTVWDPATGRLDKPSWHEQMGFPEGGGDKEEAQMVNVNRTVLVPRGA
ncbi:MAG: hypothetical protein M3Q75_06450, partial [Gemmatimonadota bacterium]|nr:hypothetical protein [Gemmatimonadota bacterium]